MFSYIIKLPKPFPFDLLLNDDQAEFLKKPYPYCEVCRASQSKWYKVSFLFVSISNGHITQDRFNYSLIHLLLDGTFNVPSNLIPNLFYIQFYLCIYNIQKAYNISLQSEQSMLE